jgi:ubiquinone/menaquinone biosynthesis C-methylase UbiE
MWRRRLLQEVEGKVLELAVGAGANFPFYPQDVDITAVDFSQQILIRPNKPVMNMS